LKRRDRRISMTFSKRCADLEVVVLVLD